MKIGIFFSTTTNVTKTVVEKVGRLFGIDDEDIMNVANIERGELTDKIKRYELVILATPTYHQGDVQKSWEKHMKELGDIDFENRNVALIGVGNQAIFPKSFVGGMGIMYYYIKNNNIRLIGKTSIEGYEFDDSSAVDRKSFFGLAIDDRTQKDMTDIRIENWVKQLKEELEV